MSPERGGLIPRSPICEIGLPYRRRWVGAVSQGVVLSWREPGRWRLGIWLASRR